MFSVYRTTNLRNGKIYVGVHDESCSEPYLGSGVYLFEAIRKYGKDAFKREVIELFETADEAYAREAEIVDEDFITRKDTYNAVLGGFNSNAMTGKKHRPETIEHFRRTRKGEDNAFYGKKHTAETVAKIKKANQGKTLTEEHRRKLSEAAKRDWANRSKRKVTNHG